jgi:hypothetical protein
MERFAQFRRCYCAWDNDVQARINRGSLAAFASANRDQSALEVWSFEQKSILILVNILANKDRRAGIVFRKMMPPGTLSLANTAWREGVCSA